VLFDHSYCILSLWRHSYQEHDKYRTNGLFSSFSFFYWASNLRRLKRPRVSPSVQLVLHLLYYCVFRNLVLNRANEEMEYLSMTRLRVVQSARSFCK
jgi:hypothetical protein